MYSYIRKEWTFIATPAILAGVAAMVMTRVPAVAVALALAAIIALFAAAPMVGWFLVVLTYPFIYLQIFIGNTVNIPYVDAFAMATALGVAIRLAIAWYRTGERPRSFTMPGALPFIAFLIVAALSLTNAEDVGLGVKFLLRPLSFFYIMFIALPAFVIDRVPRLFATFRVMAFVGFLVATMGLWSIVFPPEPGAFRRAVPLVVYGMTPLGTNHNLIAEVLVSIIPIAAILAIYARRAAQRWYVIGTVFLAAIALLTFSRNAWLTLAVEGTVILIALAYERGWTWRRIAARAAPVVAVALLAIGIFSTTTVARSSNTNRIQLTRIALAQFRDHPIIGAGVGTFQEAVARDRWYLADFGTPQEAHGLVQKLLAETGILGLATFVWLLVSIVRYIFRVYHRATIVPRWRFILLALLTSATGSIIFQLFNTSYFVSKLWLPLGIAVAAARLAERGIALRAQSHAEEA